MKHIISLFAALLLAATTAFAQDWTSVSLTDDGNGGKRLDVNDDGYTKVEIPAGVESFTFHSEGNKAWPRILLKAPEGNYLKLKGSISVTHPQGCSRSDPILCIRSVNEESTLEGYYLMCEPMDFTTRQIDVQTTTNLLFTNLDAGCNGWNLDATVEVIPLQPLNLTVNTASHGVVTASKTLTSEYAKITLTVEPDEGYVLQSVNVTDNDGSISVSAPNSSWGDTPYYTNNLTFNMRTSDATVTPVFMAKTDFLVKIPGTSDKTFNIPDGTTSFKVRHTTYNEYGNVSFSGDGEVVYDDNYDGTLLLSATTGCLIKVEGIGYFNDNGDYLEIYDGNSKSATKLGSFTGQYLGGKSTNISANSTSNNLLLRFVSNESGKWKGLDLRITIVDNRKDISPLTITVADQPYTGSAIIPSVTVKDGSNTLEEGEDYEIILPEGGCTNAGDYTITITGKGNYKGSVEKTFTVLKTLSGSGTKADPYIIADISDWNSFAYYVNSGTASYSGKFVKLTADITVSSMVGTEDHKFQGTFDGNGHTLTVSLTADANYEGQYGSGYTAPFRYVDGATIYYLHTAGTIDAGDTKFAAGLISEASGKVVVKNCWSSVAINGDMSQKEGDDRDGTHGGFVGMLPYVVSGNSLTISNCLFDGSIQVTNAIKCSGFVGYRDNNLTISNSLMAGTMDIEQTTTSSIFNREGGYGTSSLTNCYYDATKEYGLITAQGESTTATGEALRELLGSAWEVIEVQQGNEIVVPIINKDLSKATITGIESAYVISDANTTISLQYTLTDVVSNPLIKGTDYTTEITKDGASVTTVRGRGKYTIAFTGKGDYTGSISASFTVYCPKTLEGDGTKANPYIIANTDDWNAFADNVNSGTETYSGKFVKLTADITVSSMVGTEDYKFQGTFDGNGHTLTFNLGTESEPFAENYAASFRYVNGATIVALHVAGDIYTEKQYASGLFGDPFGSCTVERCHSSINIHSTVEGDGTHGGFVGFGTTQNSAPITFNDCLFDGEISGVNTTSCGGFVGWHRSEATFNNCLMAGKLSNKNEENATFSRTTDLIRTTNCYYKTAYGTEQGTAVGAMSNEQLSDALGSEWKAIKNGKVVPKMGIKDISKATITGIESTYVISDANTAIKLDYFLTDADDGNNLVENTDYTTEITKDGARVDEVNGRGNYTITFTGKNHYTGSISASFSVCCPKTLEGEGTKENPYIIANIDDWNAFADNVTSGTDLYSGKTVKLTADLDGVFTMVGTEAQQFQGTFDGDGHTLSVNLTPVRDNEFGYTAPFRYVDGATIAYLHTKGTIDADDTKFASGLIAQANGTVTIKNCWSSVAISGDMSEKYENGDPDATHGGFVGFQPDASGNITITNCLFDGSITDKNAIKCAGFVGYRNNTLNISNSLMAGTLAINQTSESSIFNRAAGSTLTDCYYDGSKTYGSITKQGISTTATGEALQKLLGSAWEVNKDGKVVPIMFTLTGDGTEESPFLIKTTDDLNNLAQDVNNGTDYAGKYFLLVNDLDMSGVSFYVPVGNSMETPFRGNFDGGGNTIRGINIAGEFFGGIFGCCDNSTIKNVTLDNSTLEEVLWYCGGIVGCGNGTTTIENCHVTAKVSISSNDCSGGIVGAFANVYGCISAATVYGSSRSGGIGGEYISVCTISNCLYLGTSVSGNTYYGSIVANIFWRTTLSNNFYTHYGIGGIGHDDENENESYDADGQAQYALTSSTKPDKIGEVVKTYDESGITAYEHGLYYNGLYYYAPDLIIDGDRDDRVAISEDKVKQTVVFHRSFKKDITATVILPFAFTASDYFKGKGTFHTLDEVYDDGTEWVAKPSSSIENIQANTPYIFKPMVDFDLVIFDGVDVVYNTSTPSVDMPIEISVATNAKDWSLVGVYTQKTWTERTATEYGFAAKPGMGVDKEGNEIGEFVAGEFVRAGKDAKIKPTRAYLRYEGEDETLKSKSAFVLPDRIVLVFPSETASVIDDPSDDPSGSDDVTTPTSEIQPTANVKVWSYDKTIYIAAAPGTAYRIIDINGRPLRTGITDTDRDEVRLGGKADGIVIVIVGGKAFKIRY